MQLQIAIQSDRHTGIACVFSSLKKMDVGIEKFDKVIAERIRARGFLIKIFFVMVAFTEMYIDFLDEDVRDTHEEVYTNEIS